MKSVKTSDSVDTVAGRIRHVRRLANPLGQKPLGWPEFAHFAQVPLGTAKNWEHRRQISHDAAVNLAKRLTAAGYTVTAEWIRLGEGPPPAKLRMGTGSVQSSSQQVADGAAAPYTALPAVAPRPAPSHMDPEVWQVVYEAVVRAYEKMVQRNELAGRRDGLQRAIELVNMMIYALNEMGEDTRDLSAAALWLHKRARGEPPETEPPPAPPPKPESGSGT